MTATCPRCGRSWSGSRPEHCPACHETFGGTGAGDRHRVGEHGPERRCLTPDEMRAAGLTQNDRGLWGRSVPEVFADKARSS